MYLKDYNDFWVSHADYLTNGRNFTIGKSTKLFNGTGDVAWSLAEIGAMGAKEDGNYWGLADPNGYDENWIRTTVSGLIPYREGVCSSLGTTTWRFNESHIDHMYGYLHGGSDYSTYLTSNNFFNYGMNSLAYFNAYVRQGCTLGVTDGPTNNWWHFLRFTHGNSIGYYTDLAIPFNDNSLFYKKVSAGAVQNGGWVKVLDTLNFNHNELKVPKVDIAINFGNECTAISTAEFINLLESMGAFNSRYWISRGGWVYASNKYINDAGYGNIHLAGATIELFSNDRNCYTLRIHTASTSTVEGARLNADFVYLYNGPEYNPRWEMIYNTDNKPTPSDIGAAWASHSHDAISSNANAASNYITTTSNDAFTLEHPNNIDISSWFGVSITNNCSNTPNYRQTTVAINARTGEATLRGGITAHGAYMTNNIVFSEAGTSYSNSPGLTWNGSTDGADLYYRTLEADQGQLLINLRDDSNATLAIAWNGEVKATFDANGYYSGSCYKASCFNARNITVGKTTKAFDGSYDIGFSLGEIGAIGAKGDGAYWGLTNPYDSDTEWIRTTTLGFIPYAAGSNSSLGTEGWRFNQGYIDYLHSAEMWSNSFHGYLDGTAYASSKVNDRGVVQCETGTDRSAIDGLTMTQVYNSGHPTPYGNVLSLKGMGDGQILVGWSGASGAHAPVYVRSKRDNGDAPWSDWAQFYTTAHPQSDISGNAGSASRLQYARTFTVGNTGKNFDGTGNISWSIDEIGAAPSSHGHNFMYTKGGNTINSIDNDTTGNWGAQETSVHFYTEPGLLHDQPSQWGYLLNIGQGAEVHQLWMTQASGNLYHRGGNQSGWSGSWRTILDSDNYTAYASPSNHNHDGAYLSLSGGTLSGQLTVNNNVYSQGFCVSKNGKEAWLDIGDNDTYIWASGADKSLQITHGGDLNFGGQPVLYGGRGNNYDTATSTIYFNNGGTSHKGRISCYNNTDGDYVQLALRTADATANYLSVRTDTVNFGSPIVVQGHKLTIQESAPSNPAKGDVWINIG